MSKMEDDPPSPEFGSHPTTPPRAQQSSTKPSESKDQDDEEDKDEEEEEPVPKKKRTLKREMREWTLLLKLDNLKGDTMGLSIRKQRK
jgi:hypothetical protein